MGIRRPTKSNPAGGCWLASSLNIIPEYAASRALIPAPSHWAPHFDLGFVRRGKFRRTIHAWLRAHIRPFLRVGSTDRNVRMDHHRTGIHVYTGGLRQHADGRSTFPELAE